MKIQAKSLNVTTLIVPVVLTVAIGSYFVWQSDYSVVELLKRLFRFLFIGNGMEARILISALLIGIGNGLFIPMNALLLAVVFFLPGWSAFMACMLGALFAALIGYSYGYFLDLSFVKKKFGKKYDLLVEEVCKDGLKSVIVLCFAPVAPNTVTNVFAGVCKIPVWKLLLGTFIGFLPGVSLLTLLGREIKKMFEEPGIQTAIGLVGVSALLFIAYKIGKRVQKKLEGQTYETE